MEQIRPFRPTDLIDRAEEQEAILLAPAVDLKEWIIKNWLTIGGELHNPDHDHIAELLHYMMMKPFSICVGFICMHG